MTISLYSSCFRWLLFGWEWFRGPWLPWSLHHHCHSWARKLPMLKVVAVQNRWMLQHIWRLFPNDVSPYLSVLNKPLDIIIVCCFYFCSNVCKKGMGFWLADKSANYKKHMYAFKILTVLTLWCFFMYIISNDMISLAIWNDKLLENFLKTINCTCPIDLFNFVFFENFTHAWQHQIALEIMLLPIWSWNLS